MKSFKFVLLILVFLSGQKAFSQISGQNVVCGNGGAQQYIVTGVTAPNWDVSDPSVASLSWVGNQCWVNWNSTFTGCTKTVTLRAYTYSPFLTQKTLSVTINTTLSGASGIFGNAVIAPSASWSNDYPQETYSFSHPKVGCSNYINWTVPSGWNIVSGQGTVSIKVQPALNSVCSGQITATVAGVCGSTVMTKNVSRNPVAQGTLNSYCDAVNSFNTLTVCADDEVYMDASTSTFCGTNTNIYVSVTPHSATWVAGTEYGTVLNSTQYAALGGLAHIDIKQFLAVHFPAVTITPGNYKVKLGVGGGGTWNERAYSLTVNPYNNYSGPVRSHRIDPLPVYIGGQKVVNLTWTGSTANTYELVYEYSNSASFPVSGTTKVCMPCFNPWGTFVAGEVYTQITIPPGSYLRYRVRRCQCEDWFPGGWVSSGVALYKTAPATGLAGDTYNNGKMGVYPNPSSGIVSLEFEEPVQQRMKADIYDVSGKKVLSFDIKETNISSYEMNISSLSKGVYFIKVMNDKGEEQFTSKLVRE